MKKENIYITLVTSYVLRKHRLEQRWLKSVFCKSKRKQKSYMKVSTDKGRQNNKAKKHSQHLRREYFNILLLVAAIAIEKLNFCCHETLNKFQILA